MRTMKKMRKMKKILIILLIAIIAIVATIVIVMVTNKNKSEKENPQMGQVIELPETTYSDMEVKNIQMEYLKDNDETIVNMEIHNTTEKKVEDESLDALLIGEEENILGQIQTYIQELNPGEQYDISVILKGDLTATKQMKLMEK